jgi:hypothetical protein
MLKVLLACGMVGLISLPSSAEARPCAPAAVVQPAAGGGRPVVRAVRNGGRRVLFRVSHPFSGRR